MASHLRNMLFAPISREKTKLRLSKVLFLVGTWLLAGLFLAVNELLKNNPADITILYDGKSNVWELLTTIVFVTIAAGITVGSFEALMSEKRYNKQPVGKLILYNAGFYIVLYFVLFVTGIYIYKKFFLPDGITFIEFKNQLSNYISSPHAIFSFVIFCVMVFFSLFLLHIKEKFGSNIMSSILSGKYFYPREESRIFMFLDIKSATTIAEKLGALKYHEFLNDFYREITYPILYKKGEIYQYVGDEITISWSEKNGLKNSNCIECFFEIENTIQNASQKFIEKYGIEPEFKAGIHMGNTVAGEIGIIKREIVYSGDTLNTASRIQSLCNSFDEKLLISKEVLNHLDHRENYHIKEIGEQELKGRKAKVSLFGIERNGRKEIKEHELEKKLAYGTTK